MPNLRADLGRTTCFESENAPIEARGCGPPLTPKASLARSRDEETVNGARKVDFNVFKRKEICVLRQAVVCCSQTTGRTCDPLTLFPLLPGLPRVHRRVQLG